MEFTWIIFVRNQHRWLVTLVIQEKISMQQYYFRLDKFKETSMTHCGKLNTPKQNCSFFTMFILNEAVVHLCYDTITMLLKWNLLVTWISAQNLHILMRIQCVYHSSLGYGILISWLLVLILFVLQFVAGINCECVVLIYQKSENSNSYAF